MTNDDLTVTYKGGFLGAVRFAAALQAEGLQVELEGISNDQGMLSVDAVIVLVLSVVLDAADDADAIRAMIASVITRFRHSLPNAEIRVGNAEDDRGYL